MDVPDREQRLKDLRLGLILDGLNYQKFAVRESCQPSVITNILKRYFYTGRKHTGIKTDRMLKKLRSYAKRGRRVRLAAMKNGS